MAWHGTRQTFSALQALHDMNCCFGSDGAGRRVTSSLFACPSESKAFSTAGTCWFYQHAMLGYMF